RAAGGAPSFSHSLSPIALIFSTCAPGLLGRSASGPFLSWAFPLRVTRKTAAIILALWIIQKPPFVLREHDGCFASPLPGKFCGYVSAHALSIAARGSGSARR